MEPKVNPELYSMDLVSSSKAVKSVPVVLSSKGMELDFHCLSQRFGSTSTPFIRRVPISSPCASSLEDSAICMSGSFDRTSTADDGSSSEWSLKTDSVRRRSSPLPRRLSGDIYQHSLSCESLCLATDSRRSMPCLHCCRGKSHSDSELFNTYKYAASENHLSDCLNLSCKHADQNGILCQELPIMSHTSESDVGSSSQDTGYQSNYSKDLVSFSHMTFISPSDVQFSCTSTKAIPSHHQCSSLEYSVESIKESSLKSSSHNHVLSSVTFRSQLLKNYAPVEPDRLIGRKMGLVTVDFISELQKRDLSHVTNMILRLLPDKDLQSAYKVNDRWKQALRSDSTTMRRLQALRKRHLLQNLQKENNGHKKPPAQSCVTGSHGPLTEVQQSTAGHDQTKHSEPQPVSELFRKYWKEAEHLKNEEALRKCPKCSSPARTQPLQDRACCTKLECKYDFCIQCRQPFHGSKDCAIATTPKKQPPQAKVGGRKSKMNLRRL